MADIKTIGAALQEAVADRIGVKSNERKLNDVGVTILLGDEARVAATDSEKRRDEWQRTAAALAERGLITGDKEYDNEYEMYMDDISVIRGHRNALYDASDATAKSVADR